MPRIAVAGPNRIVTDAAGLIADAGGSVVDTAIVAALTAMCTEPGICSPGGGGFLTIDVPGADAIVIDGYMSYPGIGFSGEPNMREITMDYGGGVTTLVEAGSVAVPGVFAGFSLAWRMFGTAPWHELMEAVAVTVEHGFPLGQAAHHYLLDAFDPIFSADSTARKALSDDGRLRDVGETVLFEGLVSTLRYIGEEGASVLYEGDLAQTIVADLESRGGQLTREDMASYEAVPRDPLVVDIEGWSLTLNPPPAVGGVTVALALNQIGRSDETGPAVWADALVSVYTMRAEELEPHTDLEVAANMVLVKAGLRSPSTVSIAAVDEDGGAVAVSCSAGYGSGVTPAGTGLMMNNAVGEIELTPGGPDAHRPGRMMMSNMAPTVARFGSDVVAIGTPGADRITSALVVTLESLGGGMDLEDAIEQPRLHPEFGDWGVRVAVESGLDLDGIEYPMRQFDGLHMYFGGVNGAAMEGGRLHGHADSRRHGSVAVVG
ncbi:MAG: gamma-glutamyltransferase [Actinobacteria bacterium]|nr:gamma-glutamyltransferase [Actinomycetota bacterium]